MKTILESEYLCHITRQLGPFLAVCKYLVWVENGGKFHVCWKRNNAGTRVSQVHPGLEKSLEGWGLIGGKCFPLAKNVHDSKKLWLWKHNKFYIKCNKNVQHNEKMWQKPTIGRKAFSWLWNVLPCCSFLWQCFKNFSEHNTYQIFVQAVLPYICRQRSHSSVASHKQKTWARCESSQLCHRAPGIWISVGYNAVCTWAF